MSKQGKWAEMAELVDESMLHTFAVVEEEPDAIAQAVKARYGELLDRVSGAYLQENPARERKLLTAFRAA